MKTTTPRNAQETRRQILDMAQQHIRRYGEAKTSITDIARDLGLTHAAVYRYFSSKAELVAAIINFWLEEAEELAQAPAALPGTAAERLRNVVIALHRMKRAKLEGDPQTYQAFSHIIASHNDLVNAHQQHLRQIFAAIIAQGCSSGEFRVADADAAAQVVEYALLKFLDPALIAATLHEPTERQALDVLQVLTTGFGRGGA